VIRIGDKQIPWKEGLTVQQMIADLNDPYAYAVVRLNGKLVSRPNFEKTPVPDNAEIFLIPLVAGG